MPKPVEEMRQRLHELVKAGEIFESIKEVGRRYGFTEFPVISDEVHGEFTADTFAIKVWCDEKGTVHTDKDILYVGSQMLDELGGYAKRDAGLAESACEGDISHEAGHVHKPKQPVEVNGKVVPYSLDEIVNIQIRKGVDPSSEDAETLPESQANLYALVKCHDGRSLEKVMEQVAIRFWHNSIYPNYELLERKVTSEELRNKAIRRESYGYAKSEGYSLWLKPDTLVKIADKVIEIDKNYRGETGDKK